MTDREIVEKIIRSNGECDFIECRRCPLYKDRYDIEPCDTDAQSLKLAKQWLKEHPAYTYAEVDLPEWWDGRPIKGYYGDNKIGWLVGYLPYEEDGYKYVITESKNVDSSEWDTYKSFKPITTPTKVTIEKDGVKKEIELTAEQVEALGL